MFSSYLFPRRLVSEPLHLDCVLFLNRSEHQLNQMIHFVLWVKHRVFEFSYHINGSGCINASELIYFNPLAVVLLEQIHFFDAFQCHVQFLQDSERIFMSLVEWAIYHLQCFFEFFSSAFPLVILRLYFFRKNDSKIWCDWQESSFSIWFKFLLRQNTTVLIMRGIFL